VILLTRSGLQSRPHLGISAKFAPSFAKLPKLQTPNAKPLDTSFGAFWQITQMQTSNAKPLEICHLQGNWHLDLAKDKNRRSPGARFPRA